MTVSSTTRKAGPFAGTGSPTSYPFAFKVFAAGDVLVVKTTTSGDTTLALTTHYTVALNPDQDTAPGGTVSLVSTLGVGETLTVSSRVAALQHLDLQSGGGFYPQTIEDALDRLTILLQQFALVQAGTVQLAISTPSGVSTLLPPPVANRLLGWDAAGTALVNQDPSSVVTDNSAAVALAAVQRRATLAELRAGTSATVSAVQTLGYWAAGDGGGGVYCRDATDTSTPHNGVTVIVAANGDRWKLTQSGRISLAQAGVRFDGVIGNADANSAAIAAVVAALPGATLLAPPGVCYVSSTISLLGWTGSILGSGMVSTTFKASAAMAQVINLNESSDVMVSPVVLDGFTIDGNSLATNGYDLRYRHHTSFRNLLITNCTTAGKEKDSWLSFRENVRYTSSSIGLWLVGSNHASQWSRCTFTACASVQLLVQSNGSTADGNSGLKFNSCDVEFGAGIGADITCTDLMLDGCYLGENISRDVVITQSGIVTIRGGTLFYGYTTSSYGVNPQGGRTIVSGAAVNGQTNGGIQYVAGPGSGTGKVSFQGILGSASVGGDTAIGGDILDYGPAAMTFASKIGRAYSVAGNNATFTTTAIGNGLQATALTAPGPTPLISVYTPTITPTQWRAGEPMYLAVVYASTKQVNAYLSTATLAGNNLVGLLPATSGAKKTYLKLDASAPTTAYAVLEFVLQSVTPGDYITIHEVFFADSRMLNAGPATIGNLYKC